MQYLLDEIIRMAKEAETMMGDNMEYLQNFPAEMELVRDEGGRAVKELAISLQKAKDDGVKDEGLIISAYSHELMAYTTLSLVLKRR